MPTVRVRLLALASCSLFVFTAAGPLLAPVRTHAAQPETPAVSISSEASELWTSAGSTRVRVERPLATGGDCDNLHFTADGTYENAYAWRNDGQQAPYYGAFAERYTAPGPVCGIVFDLTQTGLHGGEFADVYVWEDAAGLPGAVACLQTNVDLGTIALWPSISRHVVDLTTPCSVGSSWWVGQWGQWTSPNAWFMAADTDGSQAGFPYTNIAPGIGYPTGWNNVSVTWGPTQALGIGAITGGDDPPPPEGTLQALVNAASDGETVWVPPGTYEGPGNYDVDFGGRNLELRAVDGPENTIIDCRFLGRAFVLTSGEDSSSLIEGFTIRNGSAGLAEGGGGALFQGASPTVRNCVFENCVSATRGGALTLDVSSAHVEDCSFRDNHAGGQAGNGGAIYFSQSSALVEGCSFSGNQAVGGTGRGGALYLLQSTATIEESELLGNGATVEGGAIFVEGGAPTITRCKIAGNEAAERGGALYCGDGASTQIEWTRLTGNRARSEGGAIYSSPGAGTTIISSTVVANVAAGAGTDRGSGLYAAGPVSIYRTILWGDCDFGEGAEIYTDEFGFVEIECSAIDPAGIAGTGAVQYIGDQVFEDPILCAPPEPCLTEPTVLGNVHVSELSACLPSNSPCGQLIGALWIRCPVPQIPTGACCLPDGSCFPTIDELCTPFGGNYVGDGSACDPSPCETSSAPESGVAAMGLRVSPPFPNPTRSSLEFRLETGRTSEVEIALFSASGRRMATVLERQTIPAGVRDITFDPSRFASGTYYLRVASDLGEMTERAVVVK